MYSIGDLKGAAQENQVKLYQMICLLEWTSKEQGFVGLIILIVQVEQLIGTIFFAADTETWVKRYRHFKYGDTNMYVKVRNSLVKT